MPASESFQRLFDEIIDYLLSASPVQATAAGFHNYDHQLDSLEPGFRRERDSRMQDYLRQVDKINADRLLKTDVALDLKILRGALRSDIYLEKAYRRWERDPAAPLELAVYGCYLLQRDSTPSEDRLQALLSRLKGVPILLAEAKANLANQTEIPAVWAETGEEMALSSGSFFAGVVDSISAVNASLLAELKSAGARAAAASIDFFRFLKERINSRTRGTYALGREGFELLLTDIHGLSYSLDELLEIGQVAISETQRQMNELTSQIAPKLTSDELIELLETTGSVDGHLLDHYRTLVERLRSFIFENDLVTISDNDRLTVAETPALFRDTYPHAAYLPSAPFDDVKKGIFWITPIDCGQPEEVQLQQRREHNRYGSLVVTLHETYPGHHLQLSRSFEQISKVRRLFSTPVFAEGWALYCEELMYETGFYPDGETRLMQLHQQLWRACLVVIDIQLHTGGMTFTEGVNMLVEVAHREKSHAIAELKRCTQNPTQPLTHFLGKREILRLREDFRKREGDSFSLKRFHDQLLSYGTIPVSFIRPLLLEPKG